MDSIRARPRIKLTPSSTQIGLSIFTAIGVALAWALFAMYYDKLPQIIWTHFNGAGVPDGKGPKGTLIPLPIIATLMYLILTVVIRMPHTYNYPRPITPENAERQYGNAVSLMYWMRMEIVWLLVYLEWVMIGTALGLAHGASILMLPVVLIVMFASLGIHLVRAYRDR